MDSKEKSIRLYLKAMYEFKQRTLLIGGMCNNIYKVKKEASIIDIENICLQMRKLLELIAMSSLIMNQEVFKETGEKFSKMWNAKFILKDIKRTHENYFPISVSGNFHRDENNKLVMDDIEHDVLTEEKFCEIYDRCGKALHVPNPFASNDDMIKEFWYAIPIWLDLIYLTMDKHLVFLYGTDLAYVVELNGFTEAITYTLLQKK